MTEAEWREFVCVGTRTGKLATTRRDGRPHVVRIAARYMGQELAVQYGRRNAVDGELLVRLRADHVLAVRGVAD